MGYPRVLFVTSSAFNRITGGGITFSNLFRGWPPEKLFVAHNDIVPVSFDICRNYFRLGTAEVGRWPLLKRGSPGYVESKGMGKAVLAANPPQRRMTRKLRQLLVGAPWPDSGYLTPQLAGYIERARPQLIYTILGTSGVTKLVCDIRNHFRLPVAVHFMDDYLATLYRGGLFSPLARARHRALTDDVVNKAKLRLAIGDDMAAAYGRSWRRPFVSIQNAVDVGTIACANPERAVDAPMRLAYIGSIFPYAQSESLIDVAASVARLAQAGHNIMLEIYSPLHLAEPFRARLQIHRAITLQDSIHDDEIFFRTLASVDALLLPVNFNPASVSYIRYSMPTKVPAYLASGTPILAYGPAETAQIAYAGREGWGMVVDRRDPRLLDQAIMSLARDNTLRRRLSARARMVASRHDVRHVRAQFQALLAQAAENEADSS